MAAEDMTELQLDGVEYDLTLTAGNQLVTFSGNKLLENNN